MTGLARLTLPFPQIAAGLGALSLVLAALVALQGQRMHSAKIERDEARAELATLRQAWEARNKADAQAKERDDEFGKTKAAVGTPGDPAIYLCRLRAVQTGNDPAAACGAPDLPR